jgi:aminoacyl tRNA synthase complex-interacting multifunctional protein 1
MLQVEKFVAYALTDVDKAVSGDIKSNLAALHKLNKAIQPLTFAANNVFSLADVALLSVLKGKISNWTTEERIALVSICRWYDNVQHLPFLSKTLPADNQVEFVLDLPKAVAKTGAKPAEKKGEAAPSSEGADAPAGGDKKNVGGDKKAAVAAAAAAAATGEAKKTGGAEKKKAAEKKPEAAPAASSSGPNADTDFHRVEFRVGRIVECAKHPEADSLYVEKIDLGESTGPRTIVSGLVKFVPLDKMLNRLVIVVANLKPAKLKGILSAGMVLAASNADHTEVEILDPPAGAVPGERVTFSGITGEPDAQLNPKKKIFEEVKPHLHTNAEKIAQFKEVAFMTSAGPCTVATLANASLG